MDPQSVSSRKAMLSSFLQSHLSQRYSWFSKTSPEKTRQSLASYLDRFASPDTATPPFKAKPGFQLDDESLGPSLFNYIDIPPLDSAYRPMSNKDKEYACLHWLFSNAVPYTEDPKSHKCTSEVQVDEAKLRQTLSDGGYFVVESLEPKSNTFKGATLSPFDHLTAQLHSLSTSVTVQDIIGRNVKPLTDDDELYSAAQSRSLNALTSGLRPLFKVDSWARPPRVERITASKPSPSSSNSESSEDSGQESPWEHATISFQSFLHQATDHGTIRNFLDCKLYGTGDRPAFISAVADDIRGMSKIRRSTIPIDAVTYPSWGLLAHAGSLTLVHHDSAGLSTFVTQDSGVKYWFFFQWVGDKPPSLEARAFRYQAASDHNVMSMEYGSQPPWIQYNNVTQEFEYHQDIYENDPSALWRQEHPKVSQLYVIRLEPGMCLVQPPDALHAVYNATNCVAVGGHFLSFDSLPLTQLGRRADHGMCFLLDDPGVTLSNLALLALARMVFHPDAYRIPIADLEELPEMVDEDIKAKAKAILHPKLEAADLPRPKPSITGSPTSTRR